MIRRRLVLSAILLVSAVPAWGQGAAMPQTEDDAKMGQVLTEGMHLMWDKKAAQAIVLFDKVAADYDGRFKEPGVKYYSARTMAETLFYGLDTASSGKSKAVVISANWGYAYYLKGYELMELSRVAEAKPALLRAAELSPQNAQFLSELGYVYQLEKSWPLALATYQRAEAAATGFSPPNLKNPELARALRGQGYVYVELNRLDDAEKAYRRCLDINKGDELAAKELRYIQNQRAKAR